MAITLNTQPKEGTLMRLNKVKALNAASLARMGAFAKKDDDVETIDITLPDDLGTLSDAELAEFRQKAVEAFNEVYQGGAVELNADQVATLSALKDVKLALDAEKAVRATASEVAKATAAELAAAMVDPTDEVEDEDADAEAVAEVVAEAEAIVADAPVAVTASSTTEFAKLNPISVPRLKARQSAQAVVTEAPVSPYRAPVNVPGLQAGAAISQAEVAEAFADMVARAPKGVGGTFSNRTPIAQIQKTFDPRAVVTGDNAQDAIDFAVNESHLKGGSLVAAGGWCAPSATVYDLCQLESTDGILSVPEIQVSRGGVRFTQGPDWADIFAQTGFCFDEADDIAGNYITNANQSLTEGGAGLTSFTLTYAGQTTTSIPASATASQVSAALEALSTIGNGNVSVTGPAGASNGPWNVQFIENLGNVTVSTLTSTPTGGTGTLTVAVVNAGGGVAGVKPTNIVPCPSFTDVRLNVCGVIIQAGNLLDRAYPELVRRYVSGALTAHAHRVATNVLQSMIGQSTAVSPNGVAADTSALAPTLSAIELQVEDMKYRRRLSRGQTIEAIFPFWARGVIRADLSRRLHADLNSFSVSDAQIDAWFRQRGINAQFIYNFDNLGAPGAALKWPATLRFLLYPAGTFVRGSSDIITIEMLRDSTLNQNNNFTAIFTEEGWSVMKLCPDARIVTVPVCPSGVATGGLTPPITC